MSLLNSSLLLLTALLQFPSFCQETRISQNGLGVRLGIPYTTLDIINNVGIGVEFQREVAVGSKTTIPLSISYLHFPAKAADSPYGYANNRTQWLIPVLAGVRFYPIEKFFVGGRLGVAAFKRHGMGYTWEPQLGYNGRVIQLYGGFSGFDGLRYGFFTLGGIVKLYSQQIDNTRPSPHTPDQFRQSGKKLVLIGTLLIPAGIGVAALLIATAGSNDDLKWHQLYAGAAIGGASILTGVTLIVIGKVKQHKAKLMMNSVSYQRPFSEPGRMMAAGLAIPFH